MNHNCHTIVGLLPAGPILLSPAPVWYDASKVKSDKSIKNAEWQELLGKKLREDKKKAKKAAKVAGGETKAE